LGDVVIDDITMHNRCYVGKQKQIEIRIYSDELPPQIFFKLNKIKKKQKSGVEFIRYTCGFIERQKTSSLSIKEYNSYISECKTHFDGTKYGYVIDIKKTLRSSFVNVIHMLDAFYLRRIVISLKKNYNINIFTIHDGFAIGYGDVSCILFVAGNALPLHLNICNMPICNQKISINNTESILV
jgi:hypothetical protein